MESRHLVVMMTDIKGFTRATSGMGREQVEELLALHEDLLVPVLKEYGGTIVKGLGDAFLVTFEAPTAAVEAGIRIQEVLQEYNLGSEEGRQLRVRVALNAGEVNLRDQDVFGEAVNITARVESISEADHVTLTEAVYLLMDRDGVPTQYLDEVELKGIPFPVKLYRVVPHWIPESEVPPAQEAPPPPGERSLPRGLVWGLAGGGTLLLGLALGGLLNTAPDPASRLRELTRTAPGEEALVYLEEAQRSHPSPELTQAALELYRSRRERLGEAKSWSQARTLLQRFAALKPPLPLSFPEEERALLLEAIEERRSQQDWDRAEALLVDLLGLGDPRPDPPRLARWAREDLLRAWDAGLEASDPTPAALARMANGEHLVRLRERLEILAPESPLLRFVSGVRATLALDAVALDRRSRASHTAIQGLSVAISESPELGERNELRPVARILLSSFPPPGDGSQSVWNWADQLLTRRFGSWLVPRLHAWGNLPPPPGAPDRARLSNQYLRRNSARILALRGEPESRDPTLQAQADLELLVLRSELLDQKTQLAELTALDELLNQLPPADRTRLTKTFRAYVEAALEKHDEYFAWREAHHRVACDHGWETACIPDRERYRDLLHYLGSQLTSWHFKDSEWYRAGVAKRLEGVAAVREPWRSKIRELIGRSLEVAGKASPELHPKLVAAHGSLGE